MKKVILSPATPHGEIRVPPSKSAAHRAILCAALSHGRSVVDYIDLSADILATLRGADALGPAVSRPNCSSRRAHLHVHRERQAAGAAD